MTMAKDNGCSENCDVLVVDDDRDMLELLLAHMTKKGVRTRLLTIGNDLVGEIARSRPRLVLLDVMLPGFNGYQLCSSLKNEPVIANTPIYFITALPPDDVIWHVTQCGASGFIPKPFILADIDKVLAAHGIGTGATVEIAG
nr:response regulator [Candidatus Sigynarchaeum springense]